jgi:hypothetical protein
MAVQVPDAGAERYLRMTRDLFGHEVTAAALDDDEYLLALHLEFPSGLAIKVSETGDESKAFNLPTSLIQVSPTGKTVQPQIGAKHFPVVKVRVPEWLAKDKGLI